MSGGDPARGSPDDDAAYAEGAITLWGNLLTMIGMQLRETGTSREEVLSMLTMLHETNEETIRSPRARAAASRHLMAVYRVLGETSGLLARRLGRSACAPGRAGTGSGP